MSKDLLNNFVLAHIPKVEVIVSTCAKQHVLLLVKHTFSDEASVAPQKAATELPLVDVKHVHDTVVCARG